MAHLECSLGAVGKSFAGMWFAVSRLYCSAGDQRNIRAAS